MENNGPKYSMTSDTIYVDELHPGVFDGKSKVNLGPLPSFVEQITHSVTSDEENMMKPGRPGVYEELVRLARELTGRSEENGR